MLPVRHQLDYFFCKIKCYPFGISKIISVKQNQMLPVRHHLDYSHTSKSNVTRSTLVRLFQSSKIICYPFGITSIISVKQNHLFPVRDQQHYFKLKCHRYPIPGQCLENSPQGPWYGPGRTHQYYHWPKTQPLSIFNYYYYYLGHQFYWKMLFLIILNFILICQLLIITDKCSYRQILKIILFKYY